MPRTRNNSLALAVLVSLLERPMHPYEVATTLRRRDKQRSVKLNYGALYGVVESLRKQGLIEPIEVGRAGRLPERTIYQLTDAGRVETNDWLGDLLAVPATEFPQFVAALSFLPALSPEQVAERLRERLRHLEVEGAEAGAARDIVQKHGVPRVYWVEDEYRDAVRAAEITFIQNLLDDIEEGTLDGMAEWREGVRHRGLDDQPGAPSPRRADPSEPR